MAVTPDDVRAALDRVPDPEMPPVSVAELGMVVDVRVDGPQVGVDLVATFSGCPATRVIAEDVRRAVAAVDGVEDVDVRWVRSVVWDPQRITPAGREKLRAFGIAPPGPGGGGEDAGGGRAGAQTLVQLGRRTGVPCPRCGSADTVEDSPFGPTPCRSTSFCRACREPFEAIKP